MRRVNTIGVMLALRAVGMEHDSQVAGAPVKTTTQHPAQYPAVRGSGAQEADSEENQEGLILPCITRKYLKVKNLRLGRAGFEPA